MIQKYGNLFDTTQTHVGHGVNTYGVMGAGIAKEFKARYPHNFKQYKAWCDSGEAKGGDFLLSGEQNKILVNIASQERPGRHAKMQYLVIALTTLARNRPGITLALPEIGCGIGGLEWGSVKSALQEIEVWNDIEFEVWHYSPEKP